MDILLLESIFSLMSSLTLKFLRHIISRNVPVSSLSSRKNSTGSRLNLLCKAAYFTMYLSLLLLSCILGESYDLTG